jgi:hypothetical protein
MIRTASRWLAPLVVLVLVLVSAPATARADGPFDIDQAVALDDARVVKHAGIALAVAGIAAEVATIALWSVAVSRPCVFDGGCGGGDTRLVPSAIATAAIAPALLAIGIPMWSVGARREHQLHATAVSLSAGGVLHF